MTTIRELVSDAFRENNLTQVGDTPDSAEYDEAEKKLTRFITSLFGHEAGESLKNISLVSTTQVVAPNSRVIVTDDIPTSITLRDHPNNGEQFSVIDPRLLLGSFTVKAGEGTIENAAEVVIDDTETEYTWFYRADQGNWFRVTALTSDDTCPLPEKFDDYLITWLAMRIAPRMGASTTQESMQIYSTIRKKFLAEYRQVEAVGSEEALLRMTNPRQSGYTLDWETS